MAFDEELAARVRSHLADTRGITEKKMFGGLSFLHAGNMCCGVLKDTLIVRLGPEGTADALRENNTRPFDFTGKVSKTMAVIEPDGLDDDALKRWTERAVSFAKTLPPK